MRALIFFPHKNKFQNSQKMKFQTLENLILTVYILLTEKPIIVVNGLGIVVGTRNIRQEFSPRIRQDGRVILFMNIWTIRII